MEGWQQWVVNGGLLSRNDRGQIAAALILAPEGDQFGAWLTVSFSVFPDPATGRPHWRPTEPAFLPNIQRGANMLNPSGIVRVIGGIRYSTDSAVQIANDQYWDGSNFERHGRNTFLYATANGRYFRVTLSQWQGERDLLEPLSAGEAMELWESLPEQTVDYLAAFPDASVTEA